MGKRKIIIVAAAMAAAAAKAQLSTPPVISSDMVLQQGREVPIWGKAAPGERVTVSFGGQKARAKAAADSTWSVTLKPMEATATPRTLTIKGKGQTIEYTNVVVGEVWVAAGQSNMEYSMRRHKAFVAPAHGVDSAQLELRKPANPMLRVYVSARRGQRPWAVAGPESLPEVSAVGYYFARSLQRNLGVPVGIVTAALGGTKIETWTPCQAYERSEAFAGELERNGRIGGVGPGQWYGKFVAPLAPLAVRGFIWYQGESNCGAGDRSYAEKFGVLTQWWRKAFQAPDAPFYYVLLAPHVYSDRMHRHNNGPATAETLPLFREQQKRGGELAGNSEYVCITDLVDDLRDIHPSYKWTVGDRLARVALAKTYGRPSAEWSGPRFKGVRADGGKLVVTFSHSADSLRASDGKRIGWFEVAGDDGIFHPAVADITGDSTVVTYSTDVAHPRYVRFGWHETAQPNLENSAGLPAVPFAAMRADD